MINYDEYKNKNLLDLCKNITSSCPETFDKFHWINLKNNCTKKHKSFYTISEIINNSEVYEHYIVKDISYNNDCTIGIYAEYIVDNIPELFNNENKRISKQCKFIDILGRAYNYHVVKSLLNFFETTVIANYDVNDNNEIICVRFIAYPKAEKEI